MTESIMSLLTLLLCCFRHYWPWHLDHPSLILVWYPWLCSQLVQVISVISLLPFQMWNRPVLLAHFLLRCPPRLCPWSTTLRHVHLTPLSTLISSCSLNHHLYADDTQLFLSFLPTHFNSSIHHLHNALDRLCVVCACVCVWEWIQCALEKTGDNILEVAAHW